ncbi:MAG TPA: valine--tRNA ligase [Gemmatimonadales bacterium]|jgi:valyl-tRNA synthetase
MTAPLAPQFDPSEIEGPLYTWWTERGFYHVAADAPGEPYVIQMPPPNVTAVLHAGHGLTYTVQDVLVRFERMRGRKALWVPGTDHAGIATQNVVEKLLAREGKTRFDVGREAFVEHVMNFVRETGGTILDQLKALGASCDWSRTYYTLDPKLSRAVREVFVQLYEKGLIYRGKYIVNWCPRCLTTLSNEEVEKEEQDGSLWHLKYPLEDGSDFIVVATTRPETMLGDTGIAVHPGDERYRGMIGKNVRLPLVDRLVPIVADDAVDATFGSGAVKVTPAHDPTDFDIGRRHGLATIDVMTDDARMSDAVPERFRGLDRYIARKMVVSEFDTLGLLVRIEKHHHAVGHCYRCNTVVEPRLSDQWFVKVTPMAEQANLAYLNGKFRLIPEFHGDVLQRWHENLRDWCISRQLWWGHRIPVWYCDGTGEKRGERREKGGCGRVIVSRETPTQCDKCGSALVQDEDVLDTWFSSWLVPFTSLGWPDRTPDLAAFYPGHTMVTAPEILFLWVSRMIMSGLEFMGEVPFTTIYLHGTVRDTQHRKMSKSLGNGIDPLEVISRYGADAFRYTVVNGMSVGTDLILDPADLETSFASGRYFANKLWNIGRFLLGQLPDGARPFDTIDPNDLRDTDRWILTRAQGAIAESTRHYEGFRLNEATATVYRFIWNDVADWYLEQIKSRLYDKEPGGDVARSVAAHVFDVALRLLHPVMPFITEALWQRLPNHAEGSSIACAAWPVADDALRFPASEATIVAAQELVTGIRTIRADYNVPPGQKLSVWLLDAGEPIKALLLSNPGAMLPLSGSLSIQPTSTPLPASGSVILGDGSTVMVALGDLVDLDRECARLGTEAGKLDKLVAAQEGKLGNDQFVARAPVAVVENEREKLVAWRMQAEALREKRRALGCAN